jgi:hypothetical protein
VQTPSSREVFVRSLRRLSREPKVVMLGQVAVSAQRHEVRERIVALLTAFGLVVDLPVPE